MGGTSVRGASARGSHACPGRLAPQQRQEIARPSENLNFMFPVRDLITWGASQFGGRTPFLASPPTQRDAHSC